MYQFSSLETTNNKKKTHNKQHNIFSHGFTDLVPSDCMVNWLYVIYRDRSRPYTQTHTEREMYMYMYVAIQILIS